MKVDMMICRARTLRDDGASIRVIADELGVRREARQADPERARAMDRRNSRRIQADAAKAAARRETQRENSTVHRRRNGALPWDEYVAGRRAA